MSGNNVTMKRQKIEKKPFGQVWKKVPAHLIKNGQMYVDFCAEHKGPQFVTFADEKTATKAGNPKQICRVNGCLHAVIWLTDKCTDELVPYICRDCGSAKV